MTLFIIGVPRLIAHLADSLAEELGIKAVNIDDLFLDRSRDEGEALLNEAVSEADWVVYGEEFSGRERVMRASALIVTVRSPLIRSLIALRGATPEERRATLRSRRRLNSRDSSAKLNIRLVSFSYKVRKVKGALSLAKLRREISLRRSEER